MPRVALPVVALLTLLGCPPAADKAAVEAGLGGDSDSPQDTSPQPPVDADGDGYPEAEDCDDDDAERHPGADERCDHVDQDCDGVADDAPTDGATYYQDQDGDGYGGETTTQACETPEGYSSQEGDCDDSDASISPGAVEVPYDGIDQDCGAGGEDDDLDADGYSAQEVGGDDCDDQDASVYPGAPEVCGDGVVNDCEGDVSEARATCGASGTASLPDGGVQLTGERAGDNAGSAVAGAGDTDGDGLGDVLIGAFREASFGTAAGAVYLLRGGGALLGATGETDLATTDLVLYGEREYDYAGFSVGGLGDTDGDGLDDVVVGAYGDFTEGTDAGAAYVLCGGGALLGASGALELDEADLKLTGSKAADYAGRAVAGAGDLDGDGLADLAVGAQGVDDGGAGAGAVYLILASGGLASAGSAGLDGADAQIVGEAAGDGAGSAVAGAGDIDGDGLGDLIVGAASSDRAGTSAGAAWLLLGGGALTGGEHDLDDSDRVVVGEAAGDGLGSAVAGAGDIDGDGLDDVLVGAPGASDQTGGVALLLGGGALTGSDLSLGEADLQLLGAAEGDHAGEAVAGAGDTDGDGLDDVVVGASGQDGGADDAGAASLWLGGVSLAGAAGSRALGDADQVLLGASPADQAGSAVARGGDVDGDGLSDWLVGACCEDSAGEDAGAAWWIRGAGY